MKRATGFLLAGVVLAAFLIYKFVMPRFLPMGERDIVGGSMKVSANCELAYNNKQCTKNGKKCSVDIYITQCGNVVPNVVPPSLPVCEEDTKITWTLHPSGSASGAVFADPGGIDFPKKPGAQTQYDPTVEFYGKTKKKDTEFEVSDKKSNKTAVADPYGYSIHILKSGGTSDCITADPVVSNE